MIYTHKIIDTFCPPWNRNKDLSQSEHSAKQLDQLSRQGWELISAVSEFKFVLRRVVESE